MKRLVWISLIAFLAVFTLTQEANAALTNVVEFSEVVLPDNTVLPGTTYYDPYGLSFEDSTVYYTSNVFIGAGNDNRGIMLLGPEFHVLDEMTIVFNTPVNEFLVYWYSVNNHTDATAYDSQGGVVGIFTSSGISHGSFGYTGGSAVSKLTFFDYSTQLGVGRVEFEPVPVPGAMMLCGIGAGFVGWLRRRRIL